jgi:hypothetical protein
MWLTCCRCGARFDFETPGIIIKAVSADISPRSGRPIPQEDLFPDGSLEKFICISCLLHANSEIGALLGFYGTGFDFPTETLNEFNLHSLSTIDS